MNEYNHWLGKLLAKLAGTSRYAITLGQTAYYSCAKEQVSDKWRKHEDCHKMQWKRDGLIKFALKYVWYQIRYGYQKNPYEVEARVSSAR